MLFFVFRGRILKDAPLEKMKKFIIKIERPMKKVLLIVVAVVIGWVGLGCQGRDAQWIA